VAKVIPIPLKEFSKPVVFLVEGRDEESVIASIATRAGRQDIEAREVGGKNQLGNKFPPAVMQASFKTVVKRLGVIQDANGDAAAALQRVTKLLKDQNLPCPAASGGFANNAEIRVGALILPGDGTPGYLEDMFLASFAGSPELQCVDAFATCCASQRALITKERAQALLVAIGAPETRLGRAFDSGQLNADGAAYTRLRDFVLAL
jgi:hypothetical protein